MNTEKDNFEDFGILAWLDLVGSSSAESMLNYLNVRPSELSAGLDDLMMAGSVICITSGTGHKVYSRPFEEAESGEGLKPGIKEQVISIIRDTFGKKIFTANTLYQQQRNETFLSKAEISDLISDLVANGVIQHRGDKKWMGKVFSTYSIL